MAGKNPKDKRNYKYKQSFNTGEDQDVVVRNPETCELEPLPFEEKVFGDEEKRAPQRDMDTDLGA